MISADSAWGGDDCDINDNGECQTRCKGQVVYVYQRYKQRTTSINTTLDPAEDDCIRVDTSSGTKYITLLPPVAGQPVAFRIKKISDDANEVVLLSVAPALIDGQPEHRFGADGRAAREVIWYVSDWDVH